MNIKGLLQTVKGWRGKAIGGPETDPQQYFGPLMAMPNPDPILRQLGVAETTYQSIMMDPHLIGEIRSIRGSFRSHQYRVLVGQEDDARAQAAHDLCEAWMAESQPNKVCDWLEIMWQMASASFYGYRAHEVVWNYGQLGGKLTSGKMLPSLVADRPNRRIVFNADSDPLLISREAMLGKPFEPYQFVISRHMPTVTNPYGLALLSSCYWPWMFKTGGWRYFIKYCERHGLPWPVARYPQGTSDADIDKLGEALAYMHEAGYAVVQEGTGMELLSPTPGGSLPQQQLILQANREMSKALTSQSMVGEQMEVGSRAAAETAKERQDSVHDSDRDIAVAGFNQIFKWITLFNFGDGVAPPVLQFYKHQIAGKERAEVYQLVAGMGARPSKSAMLEELDIPEADPSDPDDALQPSAQPQAAPAPASRLARGSDPAAADVVDATDTTDTTEFTAADLQAIDGFSFARAAGMTEDEALQLATDAADQAIADHAIAPIYRMLVQYEQDGKTLADFAADLGDLVGQLDDEALREVLERAMTYALLRGAATHAA
ncbi:MAG: DUF935 family protein [Comamonas sp.]